MSTKTDSVIPFADDLGVVIGRKIRWPLDFHASQPCKDRLLGIGGLGLRIDQDNAYHLAVQKTAMLRRNVENAVMSDSLKFDGVHRYG